MQQEDFTRIEKSSIANFVSLPRETLINWLEVNNKPDWLRERLLTNHERLNRILN